MFAVLLVLVIGWLVTRTYCGETVDGSMNPSQMGIVKDKSFLILGPTTYFWKHSS